GAVLEVTHGPDIAGRDGGDSIEDVAADTVRTRNDPPRVAVPVLGERTGIIELSHGPDIAGRDGGDSKQEVAACAAVRTGHDAPAGAVPVLDQRPREILGIIEPSYSPAIDRCD